VKLGVNTLFYLPGEVGGSETYLLEILRVWKRSEFAHEVMIFTQLENHERLSSEFEGEGWSCILSPFAARNRVQRILREQWELPRRVHAAGVDVLWSPGYTAPIRCSCPQGVSILDMQYKRFPQDLSRVARWCTELLVQAAARHAGQLLAISEFSKREIQEFTPAPAERISVTPLAADGAFSLPQQVEPLLDEPYLLCVANSYPHKNVDQLIRAYAAVEEEIPQRLVWVGRPRLGEAAVEDALATLKHPERVLRLSGLSREQLIDLYQQADLFVFPSLYEGFGLPVLESLLAGTPVLCTRCGSLPEVGADMVHYYDPEQDDSLSQALRDVLREGPPQLPAGVAEWTQGFSWERCAQQTLAALEALQR